MLEWFHFQKKLITLSLLYKNNNVLLIPFLFFTITPWPLRPSLIKKRKVKQNQMKQWLRLTQHTVFCTQSPLPYYWKEGGIFNRIIESTEPRLVVKIIYTYSFFLMLVYCSHYVYFHVSFMILLTSFCIISYRSSSFLWLIHSHFFWHSYSPLHSFIQSFSN